MAYSQYMLNKLLGIENTNFEIVDVKYSDFEITWFVKHKHDAVHICPSCLHAATSVHSYSKVTLQDLPIGMKRQKLEIEVAKILCPCDLHIRTEFLPFKAKLHRITQRFVDYVEMLLCTKMLTVADTARIFNLDYGVVYYIDHQVLRRLIEKMEIPDPINISVDEKSWKRGHKYVTVVTDVDTGNVIWVSEGRTKSSLDEFFKVLGPERCKKIKTVSKDMWEEFALSCAEYIPQAVEVPDSFHIVKHLNESVDKCRRELIENQLLSDPDKAFIKGTNWVLRHKQENLTAKNLNKLEELEKLNQPLFRVYLHKEAFYNFFTFTREQLDKAIVFMNDWIDDAKKLGFKAMDEFAKFLTRHFKIIFNIIIERKSSSISEGINRKISLVIAMGCGYKSLQYLKLKILQRCGVLGKYWEPVHNLDLDLKSQCKT